MADQNSQDRTLPASQRKLNKVRGEGTVPRSRDLGHLVAIATCGAILVTFGPLLTDWMQQTLMQGLRFDAATVRNPGSMGMRLSEMTLRMLWVVLPFGGVMAATAVVATLSLGGWNWTLQPLSPKFGKLNPISGIANLLSKAKLIDALKGCALAMVLGTIGALYLKAHVAEFAGVLALPLPAAIRHVAGVMLGGLGLLLIALVALAAIDVPLQRHNHAEQLKMSHQELKQEQKESEGNPEVKNKIRARMRSLGKKRMLAAVPTADLVVMNPTHYAVALKYDEARMGAPRVVAKGADLLAMSIRDLARDAQVPVLQAPALARALFTHAELDHEIPAALFATVAQVLAHVYQLRAALAGRAAMPTNLPELNVPNELDPHHPSALRRRPA